jgi:hypothetical protein
MQHGDQGMDSIYAFARAHRKPVMISEFALDDRSTGDDPGLVASELSWIEAHAGVKAALYFDYDNRSIDGKNYRLRSFPAASRAMRTIVAAPTWRTSLCRADCLRR